jgi:hypothetical protein
VGSDVGAKFSSFVSTPFLIRTPAITPEEISSGMYEMGPSSATSFLGVLSKRTFLANSVEYLIFAKESSTLPSGSITK